MDEQYKPLTQLTEEEKKELSEMEYADRLDAIEEMVIDKAKELGIAEGEELDEAFPEIIDAIESQLEGETSELQILTQVTEMGITHKGSSVDESELSTVLLDGDIDIRNPNPDLFEGGNLSSELNAQTTLGQNLRRIKEIVEIKEDVDVDVPETFNLNVERFIGIMDSSKSEQRRAIYEYWRKIQQNRFPQFMKSRDVLAKEIASSKDLPEELKEKFAKIMDEYTGSDLNYIAKFPLATSTVKETELRFFNLVSTIIYTRRYLQTGRGKDIADEDESEAGDISSQLAQEFLETIAKPKEDDDVLDRGTGEYNDFLQDSSIDPDETGLDDMEYIAQTEPQDMPIDPLLAFENARGEKLIAITKEGEKILKELLDELEDDFEDGEIDMTLNLSSDLKRFSEEYLNTTMFEVDIPYYLPISALANKDFAMGYKGAKSITQEGVTAKTSPANQIGLDNLDKIESFFEDIYKFLLNDYMQFYSEPAPTRSGRTLGSDMQGSIGMERGDYAERLREALPTSYEPSEQQRPMMREALKQNKKVSSALRRFLEDALEYYFEPAYSGRMVVSTPDFVGSVGGRVMQALTMDLGLEKTMSFAYDRMARVAGKDIDVSNLNDISVFLKQAYQQSITIGRTLIENAKSASTALTRLMGKKERNRNYFAWVLSHLMEETGKKEYMREDFFGETIETRAKTFKKNYKKGRAFPIFALPYFLSANEGQIKNKDGGKDAWEGLKNIYVKYENDMPILLKQLLKVHDAIREEMGKDVVYGFFPFTHEGVEVMINKMYNEHNVDLSHLEVENIILDMDSHQNISKEYGISTEQVYLIKAHFR